MHRFKLIVLLMIVIGCLGTAVHATTPKPSLLCAITNVAECEILKGCINVLPGEVNLPTFFNIDFRQQLIRSEGKTDRITLLDFTPEGIVLQGIGSQHRAWSLLLNNEQTKVTGHVTGQHYGFTLFGVCRSES